MLRSSEFKLMSLVVGGLVGSRRLATEVETRSHYVLGSNACSLQFWTKARQQS
ncbi:hypothetical protein C8J41_1172 [Sphingomonas sp. PP-CC-3G-468]|nr:hypothetical protein C8J41_1172 [Sphingomonas sp. PP-CC-3G-468]